jgi:hypothetical protein
MQSVKFEGPFEKHKLYAGYGPFYARAHSDHCSQCRFLYPGDGPSYYFRKIAHTGFPSILRSGLRCDLTQGIDKTVRRAQAGFIRRAQAGFIRRVHTGFERRA